MNNQKFNILINKYNLKIKIKIDCTINQKKRAESFYFEISSRFFIHSNYKSAIYS